MTRFAVRLTQIAASVMLAASAWIAAPAASASANTSWVEVFACPKGISIFAVEDDLNLPAPSVYIQVYSTTIGAQAGVVGSLTGSGVPGNGQGRQYIYWADLLLTAGQKGVVRATGARNESYAGFTVADSCPPLGSVRGSAFEDLNRNGARDPGEPGLGTASWKVTTGGDWFLCGYVGGDSTFGPTVKPGTYTVIPIAQPGWRATTPVRTALVKRLGEAALNNDIGFARAANAGGDNCSQYAPPGGAQPVPLPAPNLPDALTALGNYGVFNTLLGSLNSTGLTAVLTGSGPFTLLAPADAAFGNISNSTVARWTRYPATLTELLKCHIILGKVDLAALGTRGKTFRTLGARSVTLRSKNGMVYANDAIVGEVVHASNGSVLVLDRVLFTR